MDNVLIGYCDCIVPSPDNTSADHCGRCNRVIPTIYPD